MSERERWYVYGILCLLFYKLCVYFYFILFEWKWRRRKVGRRSCFIFQYFVLNLRNKWHQWKLLLFSYFFFMSPLTHHLASHIYTLVCSQIYQFHQKNVKVTHHKNSERRTLQLLFQHQLSICERCHIQMWLNQEFYTSYSWGRSRISCNGGDRNEEREWGLLNVILRIFLVDRKFPNNLHKENYPRKL